METWRRAIGAIEGRAVADRSRAERRLEQALGPTGARQLLTAARRSPSSGPGRVTLNFHPDRVAADGRTVAAGLADSGRYLSQWATRISNGGRTAVPGGDRQRWERQLFGDAYDGCDPAVEPFPVYGALDLLGDPHGGSPRFGSCFVVLGPAVAERVTFCVGDSHLQPTDVGTVAEPTSMLAGLAEQAATGRLLNRPLGADELLRIVEGRRVLDGPSRDLDHYVEAQIHGGVDLDTDVAAIVADPSFRHTEVEADLTRAAYTHGFELRWHRGSVLAVDEVPADFRGPAMPALARRVAGDEPSFDAAAIGRSAVELQADIGSEPPSVTGDDDGSARQQLKKLWHVLLAFGSEASAETPG